MAFKKYGEETVIVTIRVPKSKVTEVKKLVADYLEPKITFTTTEDVLAEVNKGMILLRGKPVLYPCGCAIEGNLFRRSKSCKLPKQSHS